MFDELLNLEEQFYAEGYAEGQAESTRKSYIEGKEYGIQTGFQKFLLVGYLQSIVEHYLRTDKSGDSSSKRCPLSGQAVSHLEQLRDLLAQIRCDNEYGHVIENEKLLVKIRNKVRVLGLQLPDKLTLQSIDSLLANVSGVEHVKEPSVAGLTDDGMW